MLKTLRSRLILSHILPIAVIIPLIAFALVYFLETQFLLPQLSVDLGVDARVLAQLVRDQPALFNNPQMAHILLQDYSQMSEARLMLLDANGQPIAADQTNPAPSLINILAPGEWQKIQSGQAITRIDTKMLPPVSKIEVLAPVVSPQQQFLGVVRLTYSFETVLERLLKLRSWIIVIMLLGLIVGILMGSILAVTISRPIQGATSAVNRVALGHLDERLPVKDPQEIRRLAEAVNSLVDRLQTLEQSRQKLLANLVHELGRPLGALRTAIHALAKGATQDQQLTADLLAGMDEETSRLQHLLDDLNGLYDQVLGPLELDRKDVDLNDWLPKVLSPWQGAAQVKGVSWENRFAPQLPKIYADPLRLGQAIGNLADNAIKFTPTGGKILFTAQQDLDAIQLAFQDNGNGIQTEDLDKIFHPFYQSDSGRRSKQGMGLGLSIARDLVSAHSGVLVVSSQPGKGSCFTIRLPILPGA